MFSFYRRKTNLLGIDISSSAVKLVEMARKGRDYRIESYAVAALPEGVCNEKDIVEPEPIGDAIRKVIKDSRTRLRHCALAIPTSMAINKIITMPASIPLAEMETQISLEADQHIPYAMEEVNYDFEVLGPSFNNPNTVDVLLAGTRTENVEVRVAAAEMAGLTVDIVDTETHALELVLRTLTDELNQYESVAVVDFGATMTGITVFEKGRLTFSREQAFGGRQLTEQIMHRYGLTWHEAGLAKKEGNLPENYISEVLEPFKENMVRHLHRFLQFYYASSQRDSVNQILISGGCSRIPGVDEQIQSVIGTPVKIVNPFQKVALSNKVSPIRFTNDMQTLLVAAGLSLRGIV
ncbi:MAG: type IV pilus assembly protein PilM [Thiofilum sp.]|uniref:type IV pilus assembly protein PilM n=1 Tax=Thiofilum sp. TaxID=2212733 RepID=UPI0025EC8EB8|nr:type IV pilus assembly protein PilM [Thiofilum sp.]MBK8453474.1 pilus assembly protein PilM [Thiofilum sp.]